MPLPIDEQAVASQVQVVMSRDIAREAIKSLGLVGNPEFDPMVKGVGGLQQMLVMLGLAQNPSTASRSTGCWKNTSSGCWSTPPASRAS